MGKPKKIVEVQKQEVQVNAKKEEAPKIDENVLSKPKQLPPLAHGEAYFEDGPTGTIIVGDATRDQVWFRAGNNGKGCWINKKR